MAKGVEVAVGVEEVAGYFGELEDPRSEVNRKHPLVGVVTMAVMAVLAGADGPTAIARWARLKAEFLQRVLDLPHGIPSKDVFGRVLAASWRRSIQRHFRQGLARGWSRCERRRPRRPRRRKGTVPWSVPCFRSTARRQGRSTHARS